MLLRGGVKKDKEFVYLMWRGQEKVELVPLGWEAVGGKGEHLGGEQGLRELVLGVRVFATFASAW